MQKTILQLFSYDENSGNLLWKVGRSGTRGIGNVAGFLEKNGYLRIRINKKQYLAHRIVWIYFNGNIPEGMEIDHINCIKNDNKIQNLRLCTRSSNLQNQKRAPISNKSTGLLGAHEVNGKFRSEICIDGERHFLGYFNTAEDAHIAYVEKKRLIHPGCTI